MRLVFFHCEFYFPGYVKGECGSASHPRRNENQYLQDDNESKIGLERQATVIPTHSGQTPSYSDTHTQWPDAKLQ
ncbi:hypothetical protein RRG08_032879 [Elysia crispata]|uniref:Uncharacterized protein n=1 Tax=Elysia crispata TaxID=231223 RepID=A0AAE0Z4R8_9GAST|nr:hypothetical protein RRG08_032879 [Elysia crispata]